MTEDMPTMYSSVCLCAAVTDCISCHRRLSEGFIKIVVAVHASVGWMGVVVLASLAGLGRLTDTLTTSHVCMGLNSPIRMSGFCVVHTQW